jgi:sulfane dehydrogenase subunit SoxC
MTLHKKYADRELDWQETVAGNGLLHRRLFLGGGLVLAGGLVEPTLGASEPLTIDPWSRTPGGAIKPYGLPAVHEGDVVRTIVNSLVEPRVSMARTPHHRLDGTITPNGLHYVVAKGGVPDIDADKHRLLIHGLVKQSLQFTVDALHRYPMLSRQTFLESGGNSAALYSRDPVQDSVQALHGLCSCAEWTGVKLSILLDEVGVDQKARWLIAEGADVTAVSRSIPLAKAMDDAIVALYQNGEPINPGNGYPIRLLLPGFEGSTNIKWLRRLKLVEAPPMEYADIKHTTLLPDGKSWQFFFLQEVKSFITRPSPGLRLTEPGYYEISGLAYSGAGPIAKVEVSADGGQSWAEAALQPPVLSKAFTRFRLGWNWNGAPAILQSRAIDAAGNVQPTRSALIAERGRAAGNLSVTGISMQHFNAISSWAVGGDGAVSHVYA